MSQQPVPVYFIHDNAEWLEPFKTALDNINIPHFEWDVMEGGFDSINFLEEPPIGIFFNRVSPSSHYRNKRYAMELTAGILKWLESYNRVVINGTQTFQLEINKAAQVALLRKYGIEPPPTIAVMGTTRLVEQARHFNQFPFLLKHNRSGSGRGVRDFYSVAELEHFLASKEFEDEAKPIDNIYLITSFIQNSHFFRLEFCDGKLTYAVRVQTGEFGNCPNDACQLELAEEASELAREEPKFQIIRRHEFEHEYVSKVEKMFAENGFTVGGVEMIVDPSTGRTFVFDVNANTNFNRQAEMDAGLSFYETGVGMFARMIEKMERDHFGYDRSMLRRCGFESFLTFPKTDALDFGMEEDGGSSALFPIPFMSVLNMFSA